MKYKSNILINNLKNKNILINIKKIMSCYKPMRALYYLGDLNDNFKKRIKIIPNSDFELLRKPDPLDPVRLITIPCGKCIGCRLDYSREWANRMLLESYEHDYNYFLTLTYNPESLPKPLKFYDGDGNEHDSPRNPLVKEHVQEFIKRLRSYLHDHYYDDDNPDKTKVRFYACGEYGDENKRPHYHLILFMNMELPLQYLKRSPQGDIYYTCDIISRIWSNDSRKTEILSRGNHAIAKANWTSMAYTARYVTKKLSGDLSKEYDMLNYPRPFSLCSRKPGIGRAYYDKNKDKIYEDKEIILQTDKGAKVIMPPRYFDSILKDDDPILYHNIKDERRFNSIERAEQKMELTSLSYLDMLDSELQHFEARTKILRRNKI